MVQPNHAYIDIKTASGTYDGALRFYDVTTSKYYIGWDDSSSGDPLMIGSSTTVGSNIIMYMTSTYIVLSKAVTCSSNLGVGGTATITGQLTASDTFEAQGKISFGKWETLDTETTEPSVDKDTNYITANTSAQDIETFANVLDGQIIIILFKDDRNTTIKHLAGNIYLAGGADFSPRDGSTLTLIFNERDTDAWHEIGRCST